MPRFSWTVFRGRCRRNLVAGLIFMLLAGTYAIRAGQRFAIRGADATAFDQALVQYGSRLVAQPAHLAGFVPENDRELYLRTVVSDQKDVMDGLTVFLLRIIVSMSLGGLGLVLVTAGATEWEIRSDVQTARMGALEEPS